MAGIKLQLRRWWMLMVVGALALTLTSCSRYTPQAISGCAPCSGTMGSFDIVVTPSGAGDEISIFPTQLTSQLAVSVVVAASENPEDNHITVPSLGLVGVSQKFFGGYISQDDISRYNVLALLDQNSAATNLCDLPLPGQNTCNDLTAPR